MDSSDFIFKPHNTPRLRDKNIRDRHARLLAGGDYEGATVLLKNNPDSEALTASLFNTFEEKIVFLESAFDGKEPIFTTEVSDTEPTSGSMDGKYFWEQTY